MELLAREGNLKHHWGRRKSQKKILPNRKMPKAKVVELVQKTEISSEKHRVAAHVMLSTARTVLIQERK
jgi:hypothetical protein